MFLLDSNQPKKKPEGYTAAKGQKMQGDQLQATGRAIFAHAKKIRKQGEKWQTAVARAARELKS